MDDSTAFKLLLDLVVTELKASRRTDRLHDQGVILRGEKWRPIRGYSGVYEVSDCGRVRRIWPNNDGSVRYKVNRPNDRAGCRYIRLYKNGRVSRLLPVHRLVARAFLSGPPSRRYTQIDHKDTNKGNNSAKNLAWETPSRNRTLVHVRT